MKKLHVHRCHPSHGTASTRRWWPVTASRTTSSLSGAIQGEKWLNPVKCFLTLSFSQHGKGCRLNRAHFKVLSTFIPDSPDPDLSWESSEFVKSLVKQCHPHSGFFCWQLLLTAAQLPALRLMKQSGFGRFAATSLVPFSVMHRIVFRCGQWTRRRRKRRLGRVILYRCLLKASDREGQLSGAAAHLQFLKRSPSHCVNHVLMSGAMFCCYKHQYKCIWSTYKLRLKLWSIATT